MLFHTFASQAARRRSGGSDFMELQPCRLPQGTPLRDILSGDGVTHWKNDSLYIHGDDINAFYDAYSGIFTGGYYANGAQGVFDACGFNYYPPALCAQMIAKIAREEPRDFAVLLDWFGRAAPDGGLYLLGV